jgi:hypothetical protein
MIRTSLQIFDTYKTVIYFPQNVEKYMKTDDYDMIINCYKLANMQLSKADSGPRKLRLFAQMKTEMENKIVRVQKHILDRLIQFPSSPDDQKLLIDYFNTLQAFNLESSSTDSVNMLSVSPAWYCLEEEKKWFIHLMIECRDMHIADEKVSLVLKQSDTGDSSSSNTIKQPRSDPQQSSSQQQAANTQALVEAAKIQAMTPLPQERNKFIEELCELFFDIFTDYWRLGSMYLNNLLTLPTNNRKPTKQVKKHTPDDFYALVSEILTTFSNIVRAAFIPHTFKQANESSSPADKSNLKNLSLAWPIQHDAKIISQILPHCLRVCR